MGLCQICQQDWDWHQTHHPRHQFIAHGDDPRLGLPTPPPQPPTSMRGDPAMRLALIKAGVITEAQLHEAEVWLREASSSGQAVVVDDGEFKLVPIEEWIKLLAASV